MAVINAGWFGILMGGIIGIVVSYYFFRKGSKRTSVAVQINHAAIIAPDRPDEKLEVRYDGKVVPRVTRSVIGLWNDGNETIRRSDLSRRDEPRIVVESPAEILRVNILTRTREATGAGVPHVSFHDARLDFDFLNPRDGYSVEVIHTGTDADLRVTGVIQGMESDVGQPKAPSKIGPIIFFSFLGLMLLFVAIVTIGLFGLMIYTFYNKPFPLNVFGIILVVVLFCTMVFGSKFDQRTDGMKIPGVPKAISDGLLSNTPWFRPRSSDPNDQPD